MRLRKSPERGFFFDWEVGMEIRKLTEAFYVDHMNLDEALDKYDCSEGDQKVRGYGIAIAQSCGHRFGIPFRSRISHNHCFKTGQHKGLDFSKSVLLTLDEYISTEPFKVPTVDLVAVREKSIFIQRRFNKYVERYIKAHSDAKLSIVEREYRYTTLINYHAELGIKLSRGA